MHIRQAFCALAILLMMLTHAASAQDAANTEPAPPTSQTQTTSDEPETEIVGSVSFADRIRSGGNTMYFLGLCSLAALSCFLERLARLRRAVVCPAGLRSQAMKLWHNKQYADLDKLCDQNPSTLGSILKAFVRHRHCPALELSALAGDIAGRDMRQHLQRAYPIAIAATLAPLLGLLGTVIGMIESFEVVSVVGSMGDASVLAGSISKALVTTAAGLIIAVPALAFYHYIKGRTVALTLLLEEDVNEVLTTWFMTLEDEKQTSDVKNEEASDAS
ncbi:MAG: MotA/TolQ/ExbB proton channel family protein [Phycisphaeraceae bacterium JB051]